MSAYKGGYQQDRGVNLCRRSLYTFWRRTIHPPGMEVFDAPSRETFTVRRERTNTPLQALALMNDLTYVEAARALGRRLIREGGSTDDDRVAFGFRLSAGYHETTDSQRAGRPSMGAWLSYGLGTANQDLPTFVVMPSNSKKGAQPLYKRLWGSGFLPTRHQGVRFRGVGDPVLYLSNSPGMSQDTRRHILDDIARLNELKQSEFGDPEITTRIAQ